MKRISAFLLLSVCTMATLSADTKRKKADSPVFHPADKKKKNDPTVAQPGDKVLISMDGKPLLTQAKFDNFVYQVKASEPQLEVYLQMDPTIMDQLLKAQEQKVVVEAWVEKNNIRNTAEYKKQKAIGMDALQSMLDQQAFMKAHEAKPTDADAKKYYEDNKAKDPNLGSPGGVNAKGVKFTNAKDAQAFHDKLKKEGHDVEKAADKDTNVQDFGLVSESAFSFVDPKIKENVLTHKKFPASDIVKLNDDEHWVAIALGEKKAEFEPFEQVKEPIKQQLAGKQAEDMLGKKIPEYKKQFKIETHPENLKKPQLPVAPQAPGASQAPKAPAQPRVAQAA